MAKRESFLTTAEAVEFSNISARTLRRRVANGELRAYRSGRLIRYKQSDLEAMFTATDSWAVK